MNENTSRTSTRWGAKIERQVLGLTTVDVAQFVDCKLLAPQALALSLYALTDAPLPGVSVEWILQLGNGSMSHTERFTVSLSDVNLQVPVSMLRAAKSVEISARIFSIIPETKLVRLIAMLAPQSPTWSTDLSCSEEV